MENKIRVLSPELINKIAAGEVVERPASIVKELLENAIDAGANEIILELEKSGIDSINVIDNGCGMNAEEAKLAIQQHATSKISTEEDLYNINTLGFRGEALASISSICELSIYSYDGINPPVLAIANARDIQIKPGQGRAQGTTITAAKIFQLIPVRRKFLKSELTEYKYILDVFQQVALINHKISFKLIKNGRQTCNFIRTSGFQERITQIFPQVPAKELIPVFYDSNDIRLYGFIGHPVTGSRGSIQQYIFINKRPVKNNLISKAVKEGFGTALMREEQPLFFLDLELSPSLVDVNVHPRKLEVRFSDPAHIFSIINKSVATSLQKSLKSKLEENFSHTINVPSRPKQTGSSNSIQQSLDFSKELLGSVKNFPVTTVDGGQGRSTNSYIPKAFSESLSDIFQNNASESLPTSDISEYLQVFNTYIVLAREDKVLFIDQHAAQERINFEKISNKFETEAGLARQSLLIPEKIILGHYELSLIKDNLEILQKIGFVITDFKDNSCNLSEIPNLLITNNIKSVFTEVIDDIRQTDGINMSSRWREIKDKLIATIACHSSIRAGEKMHPQMVEQLVRDLFACKLPYSCPHGRPIIFELSKFQLEKNFKRKI